MPENRISDAVIHRLPKYYRYLSELEAAGIERVSSSRLSEDMGFNASQIRRDFNCFGGFGQQGYGYQVKRLKQEIKKILGIGINYKAVIIGAGNIGQALVKYRHFANEGYQIVALFDADAQMIGCDVNGIRIKPMHEIPTYIADNAVDIGIITVPKAHAQQIADELVSLGVKGIWNFAPIDVQVRRGVSVENVHLSDSLYILSYYMRENSEND